MTDADVLIVGGGLHGLSAALHLARDGRRVRVLEAQQVGAHASGYSAGGIRTLGRHPAEVPLALEAIKCWHRIADMVGDDCGFRAVGQVRVAETEAEFALLSERVSRLREAGWTHEAIADADTVRRLLPSVAPHVVGGIVARGDGFASPLRTTLAFCRAAQAAGAEVVEETRVTALEHRAGRWHLRTGSGETHAAPLLLNAAGAWGGRIARAAGEPIPLGFNAFQMLMTESLPPFLTPVVGATERPLSLKQFESGHVMIGGGHKGLADLDTGAVHLDVPRLAYSARTALELFPALRAARIVHAWAGIEGVTPDELPVIGRSAVADGLVHAFGFSGHGFALAPRIGEIVAGLLGNGSAEHAPKAFSPARFKLGNLVTETRAALLQPAG